MEGPTETYFISKKLDDLGFVVIPMHHHWCGYLISLLWWLVRHTLYVYYNVNTDLSGWPFVYNRHFKRLINFFESNFIGGGSHVDGPRIKLKSFCVITKQLFGGHLLLYEAILGGGQWSIFLVRKSQISSWWYPCKSTAHFIGYQKFFQGTVTKLYKYMGSCIIF